MDPIADKVVIITGSSRGIGYETARLLLSRGAQVVLNSRHQSDLESARDRLICSNDGTPKIGFCAADVGARPDIDKLFDYACQHFGRVDILVNNAGSIFRCDVVDTTAYQWDQTMATNVTGVFYACQLAFRSMMGRGGSIVNISSLAGIRSTEKFSGFGAYSISKHAVVGLTESLAVEGRAHNIRVNCVAPGGVNTQLLRSVAPDFKTVTDPEDIANIIVFFCDESQSSAVSGTVMEVNSNG